MAELLICTVGGATAPVVRSILEGAEPARVLFVCSTTSVRSLAEEEGGSGILSSLRSMGRELPPGGYEVLTLSDPQDLTACVREMEEQLTPRAAAWQNQDPVNELAVDFTGGTKCMSAALALVARRWRCTLRYVGGELRTKANVGVVVDGHEKVLRCVNPLDALGYQVAEDAITLCRANEYSAAEHMLSTAWNRLGGGEKAHPLRVLGRLAAALSRWDRFEHAQARDELRPVLRRRTLLGTYLSEECAREVMLRLDSWDCRLKELVEAAGRPTLALVTDLLANAERRGEENRFEDGVARLYRSVEAMAQWQLGERYGIRTASVPIEKVPESLRAEWNHCATGGRLKLGLQDSYSLLAALGDPLGLRFREITPEDRKKSPLNVRNESILAHGFQPASRRSFDLLWTLAVDLGSVLGVAVDSLPRFPKLIQRSVLQPPV